MKSLRLLTRHVLAADDHRAVLERRAPLRRHCQSQPLSAVNIAYVSLPVENVAYSSLRVVKLLFTRPFKKKRPFFAADDDV